jgi:hypothetical protein
MRFTALLFTMALTGGIHGMAAQGLVGAGQRVRITSAPHGLKRTVGRVITATADTMTVAIDRGAARDTLVLALADLQRLELAHSTRRTLQGARVGATLGIASLREYPDPGSAGLRGASTALVIRSPLPSKASCGDAWAAVSAPSWERSWAARRGAKNGKTFLFGHWRQIDSE